MSNEERIRQGEIVSREREGEEERRIARRETTGHSSLGSPAKTVWGNTIIRKRIESAEAVVSAEKNLMEAVRQRELSAGRLQRVGAEIEAEALETENRRREAARRAQTAELQDQVAHKQLELELLRLKKATEEFQDGGENRNGYQKRLKEAEEKAQFEAERKIMQTKQRLEMLRKLRAERDALIADITNSRRPEDLNEEERETVEDIRDQFQAVIDGL